jgi:hypothetical protein
MDSTTQHTDDSGSKPECPTAVMHDQCDPATCDKAPTVARGPDDDRYLHATLEELKLCAVRGCDTCATLYAGVGDTETDGSKFLSVRDSWVRICAMYSVSETLFSLPHLLLLLEFCAPQLSGEHSAGGMSWGLLNCAADDRRPCKAFKPRPAPTLSKSTFSDTAFQTITKWLHACRNNHKMCGDYDTLPRLPTRVLYLGPDPTAEVSFRYYFKMLS